MAKRIRITVDEDKFNRMLVELNSSREQLLDCDENEWSEQNLKIILEILSVKKFRKMS